MAQRTWKFEIDGREHTVELVHSAISGKRVIPLDGSLLAESRKLLDTGSQHPFQVDGHEAVVYVRTNGWTFSYDLALDGQSLETGRQVQSAALIPRWAWFFVAACGIIPIVALGGAIPVALGLGGAFGCLAIARRSTLPVQTRVILCAAVTALCWVVFVAVVYIMAVWPGLS